MVFGMSLVMVLSILVCIYGWGLTPQSWSWIIGVGVGGQLLAQIIVAIGTEKGK